MLLGKEAKVKEAGQGHVGLAATLAGFQGAVEPRMDFENAGGHSHRQNLGAIIVGIYTLRNAIAFIGSLIATLAGK